MSTNLKTIGQPALRVTQFSGGDRGVMLQITPTDYNKTGNYAQLTHEQVEELRDLLTDWLEESVPEQEPTFPSDVTIFVPDGKNLFAHWWLHTDAEKLGVYVAMVHLAGKPDIRRAY